MKIRLMTVFLTGFCLHAQADTFNKGPVFTDYGQHAAVSHPHAFSDTTTFHVAFDTTDQATPGDVNRKINSLARFINMHVANGVKKENIHLALVVHGKGIFDLLNKAAYQENFDVDNANAPLINALLDNQVTITVCGQSAAYYGIEADQFIEGVTVSLSAMTAHAELQQQGYTLNPF